VTTDPFDRLRAPDAPALPPERFVNRLRHQLVAALSAELPTISLPERTPTMTTNETTATAPTASTPAATTTGPANVLVPYLSVTNAAEAISWYVEVLGARELLRYDADDGRVGHAELDFTGALLYLADEYPELGFLSPTTIGGAGGGLSLKVDDVDAVYAAALERGALSQRAPQDEAYGDRSASIVDPFGHRWTLQTPIATPNVDEINESMEGFTVRLTQSETGTPETSSRTEMTAMTEVVELGYFTMSTPDTTQATRFYGALFGWQPEPGSMGAGYAHVANTKLPSGFTPGPAALAPELYFRVAELAPYVERVRQLGGRVESENAYDSGSSADCRDDQGRRFLLWQPAPGY